MNRGRWCGLGKHGRLVERSVRRKADRPELTDGYADDSIHAAIPVKAASTAMRPTEAAQEAEQTDYRPSGISARWGGRLECDHSDGVVRLQPEQSGPEAFVGRHHALEGELGLDASAARRAVAAAAIGVAGGLQQGLSQGRRVVGRDEPAGLAGGDQVLAPLDRRGHHGAAGGHGLEDNVGHPLPERGQHQHVGGAEQRGHIGAAAEPVDPRGQRGPRGEPCQEPGALGTVADQDQVPVGSSGDDPLGGVEQVGQALLDVEPADTQRKVRAGGDADRCAGQRRGLVQRREIDPVGDDGQPLGTQAHDLAAEPLHPARDADRAGRQPHREPVQCAVPTLLVLGDAQAAEQPGGSGQRRGQPRGHIGMEEEALHQPR